MKLKSLSLMAALVVVGCGVETEPETTEDVNPSRVERALTMPACGTALASWDGTTAYSNGSYTGTGTACAGSGTYGLRYQCVELVMRHFSVNWGLRWYGNANQLLANAPTDSVDVYYNGNSAHPPVPGDLIVFDGGSYGHAALVTAVTSSAVHIMEQNVTGDGTRVLSRSGGSISAGWSGWTTQGWAHAKANTTSSPRSAKADVNGDGRADLVSLHSGGTAYYWPGLSGGTFGGAVASFAGTMNPALFDKSGHYVVDVADVTGDGKADLVTTLNGTLYIYLGTSTGAFGSRIDNFAGTLDASRFDGVGHEFASERILSRRRGCTSTGC